MVLVTLFLGFVVLYVFGGIAKAIVNPEWARAQEEKRRQEIAKGGLLFEVGQDMFEEANKGSSLRTFY